MKKVVIASAARTAIGNLGGALQNLRSVELGAAVISEALIRAGVSSEQVDGVIMGNVLQAGQGQNPARQAAIKSGLPVDVDTVTINKVCGSGLQAVILAAQAIKAGDAEIIVAGGMESMSQSPFLLDKARFGYKLGDGRLIDSVTADGLSCAYGNYHMGITAEMIAEKYGISREEQDRFSAETQAKCGEAMKAGRFTEEILPISIPQRKGDPIVFETDEFPRPGTTPETLAKLRPAFKPDGTVTAGNASGISDGAAALLVLSEEKAAELGLTPLATIVSYANAGVEPALMGIGPILASRKALGKAGLSVSDLGLVELNEAFAVQSIAVNREMGWDQSIVNVNGGAIALGHPIGASGARILVTLLYEMRRRSVRYGLASLCIGGGEGSALIVEMPV